MEISDTAVNTEQESQGTDSTEKVIKVESVEYLNITSTNLFLFRIQVL